jgi:hypothetical protein
LCLGCPPPDAFNVPITEALPLADQPHILQPNARREDIFGMPKQAITVPSTNISTGSPLEIPPIRLGLSSHNKNDLSHNTNANTNTVVIVTPAPVTAASSNETVCEEIIQQVPKSVQQKRPLSPKPGSSKMMSSSSGSHEIYYKKNRHFFMNSKDYDDDEEDSGDEEPQDLSQQGSSKMDIDESSSNARMISMKVVKSSSEMNMFDDSDDNDEIIRPPAHKKNRFDEESSKIIHSGPSGTTTVNLGPDTSITPELTSTIVIETIDHKQDSDQSVESTMNRPPIIVTRRNVADAIESVTANLLAKNKKQMLSECASNETPLNFLPNSFVYDISKQGEIGYERCADMTSSSQSGSPGKSVIVRVGPSVSITFINILIYGNLDTDVGFKKLIFISFQLPIKT